MDKSLDEIIAEKKIKNPSSNRRGGSRGNSRRGSSNFNSRAPRRQGQSFSNGNGIPSGPWAHDMFQGRSSARQGAPRPLMGINTSGPIKLIVSNLDYAVTEDDVKELFGEFGSMESSCIHYDNSGCSLGSAQVIYSNRNAAQKAKQQYNGVHLDRRPMRITIEGDSGSGMFGGGMAPVKRLTNSGFGGRSGMGGMRSSFPSRGPSRGTRDSGRGSGGRGRGGSGGRGRGSSGTGSRNEKPKSAEELDKELDAYLAASSRK